MINFINDFAILHLSDLHIVNHSNDYSIALRKMIDHIAEKTKNIGSLIVVFTGDLVEKGNFDNCNDIILKFFSDLKSTLGDKIIDIIFTPGNHDKIRGRLNLLNTDDINDETFWNEFKKNDWKYFEGQFSKYSSIVHEIRKEIFELSDTYSGTYGLHVTHIGNFSICFVCLNSAWSCMGEHDIGNLRIGRFQLDDLSNQYKALQKNIDLTIVLMHHPTEWLTKPEQRLLNGYMLDKYRLNTNIILQGHIHEKDIYNWYNQKHSITTFVTGMGWDQQKNQLNDAGHRYSLYEINCACGIVRVNTYVSDKEGIFHDDTEVYEGNNIIFPLYVHKYLEINKLIFDNNEINCYYPNNSISENLRHLHNQLSRFIFSMFEALNGIQNEWITYKLYENPIYYIIENLALNDSINIHLESVEELFTQVQKSSEYIKEPKFYERLDNKQNYSLLVKQLIEKIRVHLINIYKEQKIDFNNLTNRGEYARKIQQFSKKQTQIFLKERFFAFLGEFCTRLQKKIFVDKMFEDGDVVRFHFRALQDTDKIIYKKIFTITTQTSDTHSVKSVQDTDLTDIEYEGSLIKKSFEGKTTFLHTLNPSSNNIEKKEKWLDFLTIAPNEKFNIYNKKNDDERIDYPCITFGITVNNVRFQEIIRNLAYIGFDVILSQIFFKFFEVIPYNIIANIKHGGDFNGTM